MAQQPLGFATSPSPRATETSEELDSSRWEGLVSSPSSPEALAPPRHQALEGHPEPARALGHGAGTAGTQAPRVLDQDVTSSEDLDSSRWEGLASSPEVYITYSSPQRNPISEGRPAEAPLQLSEVGSPEESPSGEAAWDKILKGLGDETSFDEDDDLPM